MKVITPTGGPMDYVVEEHELGHLLVDRFGEDYLWSGDKARIREELEDEHSRAFWMYQNTYERDILGEAIAETFAARRFGWGATDLGFDPALGTPKIWAFVNMVADAYEIDSRVNVRKKTMTVNDILTMIREHRQQ